MQQALLSFLFSFKNVSDRLALVLFYTSNFQKHNVILRTFCL